MSIHLHKVYSKESKFCIIFVSQHYSEKNWTNHEWKSALERALKDKEDKYILPVRVDYTNLDGFRDTICYLNLIDYSIEEIAEIFVERLENSKSYFNDPEYNWLIDRLILSEIGNLDTDMCKKDVFEFTKSKNINNDFEKNYIMRRGKIVNSDSLIEGDWPTPIALVLSQILNIDSFNSKTIYESHKILFIVLIKYLAFITINNVLNQSNFSAEVRDKLAENLDLPKIVHWVEFLECTIQELYDSKEEPFVFELIDRYDYVYDNYIKILLPLFSED